MLNKIQTKSNNHPCFFSKAKNKYGRIHLPVAPSCNIQCVYCRRDYDCVHENRPGVTKIVMSPEQALISFEKTLKEMPFISVAGIAGPGDAFSKPELTLKTFELIRNKNNEISLCVSTNGLNIKDYIPLLSGLNVRYVTITVNCIDPVMGVNIYKWINMNGIRITGIDAAEKLIERQLEAISILKRNNFIVKVNSVVIPGINEDHLVFLSGKMGSMGVDLMNFIPVIPVKGTDIENIQPPGKKIMHRLRKTAGTYVSQMHHCTRCRSDAKGLLDNSFMEN